MSSPNGLYIDQYEVTNALKTGNKSSQQNNGITNHVKRDHEFEVTNKFSTASFSALCPHKRSLFCRKISQLFFDPQSQDNFRSEFCSHFVPAEFFPFPFAVLIILSIAVWRHLTSLEPQRRSLSDTFKTCPLRSIYVMVCRI